MYGDEENVNRGGWVTLWAVGAAAIIATGLSLAALFANQSLIALMASSWTPETWAVFTVHLLIWGAAISIGVWLVLHFGFVRWMAPQRTSAYYLIILGTILVANGAVAWWVNWYVGARRAHDEAVMQEVDAELDKAFRNGDAPVDMRVEAKGEAGVIVHLAKQVAKANQDAGHDYTHAIKALDLANSLKPKRLAADRGLADTQAQLAKARATVKTYRLALQTNAGAFRTGVAKAKIDTTLKTALLNGFNARMASIGDLNARLLADEDGIIAEYQYAMEDLRHAKGRWIAREKAMQFTDPRDLQKWQEHMLNIKGFSRDEDTTKAYQRSFDTRQQEGTQ